MTFDDDLLVLMFDGGRKMVALKTLHLEWPPPDIITFQSFQMKQTRRSQITDAQREQMTHVARCAEYYPVKEEEPSNGTSHSIS